MVGIFTSKNIDPNGNKLVLYLVCLFNNKSSAINASLFLFDIFQLKEKYRYYVHYYAYGHKNYQAGDIPQVISVILYCKCACHLNGVVKCGHVTN